MKKNDLILLVVCGLIAGLSLKFHKLLQVPWLIIAVLGLVLLFTAGRSLRKGGLAWLHPTLFTLCTVLLFGELIGWMLLKKTEVPRTREVMEGSYRESQAIDEILGFAPERGRAWEARKLVEGEALYDVTYTIAEGGYRITGTQGKIPQGDNLYFFGGSFTYGEGLNEGDSLPWLVCELASSSPNGSNWAYHGYGPHMMLSQIRSGRIEAMPRGDGRSIAVYGLIYAHGNRAAGNSSWEKRGPAYRLEDGKLVFKGQTNGRGGRPAPELVGFPLNQIVYKSKFYQFLDKTLNQELSFYPHDYPELLAAILAESKREFLARYPQASFHVLLWDEHDGQENSDYQQWHESICKLLEGAGVEYWRVSDFVEDLDRYDEQYILHPLDKHPNGAINRKIAAGIVEKLKL